MINKAEGLYNYLKQSYSDNEVLFLGDKIFSELSTKYKQKIYTQISIFINVNSQVLIDKFDNAKLGVNKENKCVILNWGLVDFYIYTSDLPYNTFLSIYDTNENTIPNYGTFDIQNHILRFTKNKNINNIVDIIIQKTNLGYTIEPQSLKYMQEHKNEVSDYTAIYQTLGNEHIESTLKFLNQTSFFVNTNFESSFNRLYSNIDFIAKYKSLPFLVLYYVMFKDNLYNNKTYKQYLNTTQKYIIQWLDKNYNILTPDVKTLRINIYNSIDDKMTRVGMPLLKKCIIYLNLIHKILDKGYTNNYLMFALCGRPYFKQQICLTNEEINSIFLDMQNIKQIKQAIIKYILILDKYPEDLYQTIETNKNIIIKDFLKEG